MLKLRLFGGFHLQEADGREIPIAPAKDQALFAYLALQGDKRFSRGHLAGLLWGGQPESKARHSLSQSLSSLADALGPAAAILERGRNEIDLAADSIATDVGCFLELCGREGLTARIEALELYADALLSGYAFEEPGFDDWVYALRADLLDLALQAGLSCLATTGGDEASGRMRLARRLVQLDPCCEVAHQELIRLYAAAGEVGAAHRQFEACTTSLREELGVEPAPETLRALETGLSRDINIVAGNADPPRKRIDRQHQETPSLVVLPFTNLAGDPELDHIALGLADDITTELTQFHDLFVISRYSAFSDVLASGDTSAVCRRLGVRHCLRGSLRRSGTQFRINLHLVDGENGQNVWGERYDLGAEELPGLPAEVLGQIIGRLAAWLERDALQRARHKPLEHWNAYDHMLQGLQYHNRSWYGIYNTMRAIRHFDQAIAIDPEYARAHAYLACARSVPYFKDRKKERLHPCTQIAQHALELDPSESEAHRILGGVHLLRGEHELSRQHFAEALRIQPGHAFIMAHAARYHMHAGDPQRAISLLGKARQLSPAHPPWFWEHVGIANFVAHHYQSALAALNRIQHSSFYDQLYAAASHACLGNLRHARHHVSIARQKNPRISLANAAYYLPYREASDLQHVLIALTAAGLTSD